MAYLFYTTPLVQVNRSISRIRCIQKERVVQGFDNPGVFLKEKVKELALRKEERIKKSEVHNNNNYSNDKVHHLDLTNTQFGSSFLGLDLLTAAHDQCHELFVKENDNFNFGTLLMNPEKRKAILAIWAWGRRIDELVDGLNGSVSTHEIFDRMEEGMINIYKGRPFDIYDVALADTLRKYAVDFQLFKDLIDGTRLDLKNRRFKNFDGLYLYRYYCASSFFLMLIDVMGISLQLTATLETTYNGLVTLGNSLTLIDSLRDIGEENMTVNYTLTSAPLFSNLRGVISFNHVGHIPIPFSSSH